MCSRRSPGLACRFDRLARPVSCIGAMRALNRKVVMRKDSRFISKSVGLLMLAVLFGFIEARAQNRERYVVSAKAGGVNMVTGDVMVKHQGVTDWEPLTSKDDLHAGESVKTGSYGRAEVLLNPGSYLRIAENSEFEMTDPSLDSLRIKIVEGSALLEVTGADETKTSIEAITPQSRIIIDRRGLYRINLTSTNRTDLLVRKGRAIVSGDGTPSTTVKDGKMASISGSQLVVAKFDKKDQDAFDVWSKDRGAALVAANSRVSQGEIARNYSRYGSGWGPWGYGGYGSSYRYGGLWIFDPFIGYHTFFPFYSGWYSPYGHHYRHGFGISPFNHFGGRGVGFGVRHGFRGRSFGRAGGAHFGGRRR